MNGADIAARLDRAKHTGPGRWIARCPAHEDKNPSLSIRELEDGRTLIHCFGGCDVQSVVGAMGLSISDLFPPRPTDHKPQPRRGPHPLDALHCLAHEARVVLATARMLQAGEQMPTDYTERLSIAARRICAALDVAHA